MAKVVKAKKIKMALADDVLRSTGYVLGGVSPLGQKKKLTTVIDSSAQNYQTVFVSAGKRGLELELSPAILQQVSQAKFAAIAAR
jgi:Cys-tRNA(Pro)/Cys-tRNA(Cys) deacylase